jgi:hypothetical protein
MDKALEARPPRINTNELRDFADTLPTQARNYLHAVATELDATRTERNMARAALAALKGEVK